MEEDAEGGIGGGDDDDAILFQIAAAIDIFFPVDTNCCYHSLTRSHAHPASLNDFLTLRTMLACCLSPRSQSQLKPFLHYRGLFLDY